MNSIESLSFNHLRGKFIKIAVTFWQALESGLSKLSKQSTLWTFF